MSGHSKWATTKHKKAAIDAKRSSLFSKLSRNITVAAKMGGDPNPDNNATLAAAVARARMVSMPNAKIKAAIDKAFGAGADAAVYEEIVYDRQQEPHCCRRSFCIYTLRWQSWHGGLRGVPV